MNKIIILKVVNTLLGLSFLIQAATGAMMKFSIGMGFMEQTLSLHNYNGFVLVALAAAHLYLNWYWVKSTLFKKKVAAVQPQK